MADGVGRALPVACEDWAHTKAAYRLFSNERVTEKEILSGHIEATLNRLEATDGPVLILHDTTDFIFKRGERLAVGWPKKNAGGRVANRLHTKSTVHMHGSLAVTLDGLPLGLAAAKIWERPDITPRRKLPDREYKALPLEQKESYRWFENMRDAINRPGLPERCIHVADREADMLALYHFAQEHKTHFLVRANYNRPTDRTGGTIAGRMNKVPVAGTRSVTFKDASGAMHTADLQIKYSKMTIVRSRHKRTDLPPIEVTIIHAYEKGKPKSRPRLEWKLATNLEVKTLAQAVEKLDWYAMRWKIETFHKILKSGCKVEDSKMRTTHRLTNLIAVSCILGWRIFWMTMVKRLKEKASPELALTKLERLLLDRKIKDKNGPVTKDLAYYVNKIARLGGYLNRANDPPPGNLVMWRGMTRLSDMTLGAELMVELVGN